MRDLKQRVLVKAFAMGRASKGLGWGQSVERYRFEQKVSRLVTLKGKRAREACECLLDNLQCLGVTRAEVIDAFMSARPAMAGTYRRSLEPSFRPGSAQSEAWPIASSEDQYKPGIKTPVERKNGGNGGRRNPGGVVRAVQEPVREKALEGKADTVHQPAAVGPTEEGGERDARPPERRPLRSQGLPASTSPAPAPGMKPKKTAKASPKAEHAQQSLLF